MATTKQFIRIVSRVEGFRRAGLAHSCAPCDYPVEAFTDTQLAQLEAEPNLIVRQVEKEIPDAANEEVDTLAGVLANKGDGAAADKSAEGGSDKKGSDKKGEAK